MKSVTTVIAVLTLSLLTTVVPGHAASVSDPAPGPGGQHQHSGSQPAVPPTAAANPSCDQMMTRMMASTARLSDLLTAMNAAEGDDRIPAMAALLSELVSQRQVVAEEMMQMGTSRSTGPDASADGQATRPMAGCMMK